MLEFYYRFTRGPLAQLAEQLTLNLWVFLFIMYQKPRFSYEFGGFRATKKMQMFTLYRNIYVEWGRNGGGMGAQKVPDR